jgi:PLAT/LH2 domain
MRRRYFALLAGIATLSATLTAWPQTAIAAPSKQAGDPVYEITMWTSCAKDAGTDSNIYIMIEGRNALSNEMQLDNAEDNNERCKRDYFEKNLTNLGELTRIRLRSNGAKRAHGWLPEEVRIRRRAAPGITARSWTFPAGEWISKTSGLTRWFDVATS